ncbi:MAG TPA: recombinase family protein, partial [Gemmataceae bacterium]|nr:recombinase family protein [Gemmataceae bacterium]
SLFAAKGAKVLLALTTNRLFRKMYKCMRFVEEEIVERGHRCIFVKTGIDTAQGQQWRLPLQVHSLVDEMSGTMYAANIRTAHEGLFLKNWVTFTVPYGYCGRDVDGPLTKRGRPRQEIAIHSEEAAWVRRIFAWFVTDRLPMARILELLNAEQALLPPKAFAGYWTHQALRYLLENPCYRGEWAYGRGENVLVSQKDYVKRRMRDKPLKTQQVEHLRLVSDEAWYAAQKLMAESPQRAGRKPRDGDRTTRPRVLNGLLYCAAHDRPLKVCGNRGQWMTCMVCRNLPKETRPLQNYLPRALALRKVCEAIAEAIRADTGLVEKIVVACRAAATVIDESAGRPVDVLKARLDRLTSQINFVLQNPGEAEADRAESAARVKSLRADRAAIAAEVAAAEAAASRPAAVPAEAEVMAMLGELETVLVGATQETDPADAGAVRVLLEMLTGGRILVEQSGDRRRWSGWLRGRFILRLLATVSARLDVPIRPGEAGSELVIDFKDDGETVAGRWANNVKELADQGLLLSVIADRLGIDRHQVTAALRIWHERHGLPAPEDGRVRRAAIPAKNRTEPVFHRIADEVKRLYDEGLLMEEIAAAVGRTRETVRAALEYWFSSRGRPTPDGRGRRKTLPRKNRHPRGRGPEDA